MSATSVALGGLAATLVASRFAGTRRRPRLHYRPTPFLRGVIDASPALTTPYRPTPWAFNRHAQLALLALEERQAPPLRYDRRDVIDVADGGRVALDWIGLGCGATTPTVVVLPTICGDGQSMRVLVGRMRALLGWRVVVCNRRGHGDLPLASARFSLLGSVDDLRLQLRHVREHVPGSQLYAIGVSAGSALLVRYLGEEGAETPLTAAVAWCPGYDTTRAFGRVHPAYDRYLTRVLKDHFVVRHDAVLHAAPGYDDILASRSVAELHDRCHALAGFASAADYHGATNPMVVAARIRVPLLVLNATDDPVCTVENVREHLAIYDTVPESLLVLTARGSHCAFFEGAWPPSSWAHRAFAEYLSAVHARAG